MKAKVIYQGDHSIPGLATVKWFEVRIGDKNMGAFNDVETAIKFRDEYNSCLAGLVKTLENDN